MSGIKKATVLPAVLLAATAVMISAGAAEVTMDADVLPPAVLKTITPTGTGTSGDPYLYTFTTANGLVMGVYKIYGNGLNNKHTKLDLNGGNITGTQSSTAFDLKCAGDQYAAGLTIINVGVVQIGSVLTHAGGFNPGALSNAGSVTIGQNTVLGRAGKIEIKEIISHGGGEFRTVNAGSVALYSKSDVLIWDGSTAGNIDTSTLPRPRQGAAGTVTVKHDGAFLVGFIYTACTAAAAGNIVLDGDVLSDGASNTCSATALQSYRHSGTVGAAGNITVSGYTDITISNGIESYNDSTYGFNSGLRAGNVSLTAANDIVIGSTGISAYSVGGSVGDTGGLLTLTATNGAVTIGGDIVKYSKTGNAQAVNITAGGAVSLAGVDARVTGQTSGSYYGGNLIVSAGGNLDISGTINLEQVQYAADQSRDGYVDLSSTGGAISLASLDMSKIRYAKISGSGNSTITGGITNFDTGGSQTALRTPSGKKIFYDPTVAANSYLSGQTYTLADLAGTANAGGTLEPCVNIWTNGAGGNTWNTAGNWSRNHVPVSGEGVLFTDAAGGGSNTACNAAADNVAQNLASFTVAAAYTSTITFAANFGDAGTLGTYGEASTGTQVLTVTGDVTLNAGTLVLTGLIETQTFVPGDVDAVTDRITLTAHGYSTGDVIQITTDTTMPGGITSNKGYYVRAVDANTFTLHPTWSDAQAGTNTVDITDGGTGTHTSTRGVGATLNAANFTVAANAVVHSDARGFPGGQGPGAGGNGWGATHGGRGSSNRAAYYGAPTAPVTLGSGGGTTAGIKGGGAIKFSASGTITINGTVRANGQSNGFNYGGGAGGSIWMNCATFAGSGLLQANGGNTGNNGGGGGRVAVSCSTLSYTGEYECAGGTGGYGGRPGTLSLPSGADLVVTRKVGLAPGAHTLGNVTVAAGGVLAFHSEQSGTGTGATGTECALTASNVTVQAGGIIDAEREGFMGEDGPGKSSGIGFGASHGGRGGNNTSTGPYGSATAPITLGSGGGNTTSSFGGGAIKIDVTGGTITVDGTIRANGLQAINGNYGGAAGGSIWLLCDTLAGGGLIQANGGPSNRYGGGGGRIAASWTSSTFTGSWNCGGGAGGYRDGAGGTLSVPAGTSLVLDKDVGFASGTTTLGDVTVQNGVTVTLHGTQSGTGTGATGTGCELLVSSLDVQAGGVVSANLEGFVLQSGPGAGGGTSGGATHGGRGNGSSRAAYGVPAAPVTFGSGNLNGIGGGAIKINAGGGNINIAGTITAEGTSYGSNYGGCAGGSIYLLCGTLSGSGVIKAKGGNSHLHGGGGGRIALSYTTSTFTGSTNVSGGLDTIDGSGNGEAGSVLPGNLDVADHSNGQLGDAYSTPGDQFDKDLYGFNFVTDGNTDDAAFENIEVTQLVFDLSAVTGIANTDITDVRIFRDSNNDGSSSGETEIANTGFVVSDLSGGTGTLTVNFAAGVFVVDNAAGNVNFILRADTAGVAAGDGLTIQLNVADSKITAAGVDLTTTVNTTNATNAVGFAELAGATTSVTHEYQGVLLGWDPVGTGDISAGNEGNDVSWNLGQVPYSSTQTTVSGAKQEDMRLKNYGDVAIEIYLQLTNGAQWFVWNSAGNNTFEFYYTLDNADSNWQQVPDNTSTKIVNSLGTGATQELDFKLKTPTSGASAQQTITVTLTAQQAP